jgi:Zn ribbon nucleic-acid-binding protein
MLDVLVAAQWKEMAITALPLRLCRACGHKTKREKQKMQEQRRAM